MAGIGVWVGGYLSYGAHQNISLVLASLAAALVCAAGNALNDFLDIEVDRKVHPERVLPTGALMPYSAILAFVILNLAGVLISLFVNMRFFLVVIFAVIVLVLYNVYLKKTPLWGNLAVSILAALTFISGGLAVRVQMDYLIAGAFVPAMFAFLFHLGREMLKDLADFEGDAQSGYKTMPALYPSIFIEVIVVIIYLLVLFLMILAVAQGLYRPIFGYIVLPGVGIPLAVLPGYLLLNKNRKKYGFAGQALKGLMVVGLVGFLAGRL